MSNDRFDNQIRLIVEQYSTNNPPNELCTIIRSKPSNYCDIKLKNNDVILINIPYLGGVRAGTKALVTYPDGDQNNPLVIGLNNTNNNNGGNMVGIFNINNDGDLIVRLPCDCSNPYYINNDGDLIYRVVDYD